MSWSQIKSQSRLAAERRFRDQVMDWRINREPHLESKHQGDLRRDFRARERDLEDAAEAEGMPRQSGLKISQIESALGPMKRRYKTPDGTTVDADEWDREHGTGGK